MSRVLSVVLLASLMVLLSCSIVEATRVPDHPLSPKDTIGPTPTLAPTAAPEPKPGLTATQKSTATLPPDPTPVQEPGPRAGRGLDPGQISPLPLDDPTSIDAQLAESELACLLEAVGADWLPHLFASAIEASAEGQVQIINCLEDETLTRLYLAGPFGGMGPLSVESSACIRSAMEVLDLRSILLAGFSGDEQMYTVGGLSAYFVSLSCLRAEFAAVVRQWQ